VVGRGGMKVVKKCNRKDDGSFTHFRRPNVDIAHRSYARLC
jgi:hypothetical protein